MKNGKRRWWLIALVLLIVVAAAITATLLLLNRNKSATVHYLTSKATTGTIAETVQADFTLNDAQDATTISLSGVGNSTSGSSTGSGSTSTTSITSGTGATIITARVILADKTIVAGRTVVADDTASPSPSPTTTAAPTLTSFKPTSGPVGSRVTLTGSDFTGATAVTFDGTAAKFTVNSATKISATVPGGATSGKIAVTTPAGTATSVISFKVTPKPTPTRSGKASSRSTASASGGSSSRGSRSSTYSSSSSTGSGSTTSGSGSTTSSAASGVVTHMALAAGATPHTLQRLLSISGKPIFAFVSTAPLYKTLSVNLSSGAQKTNVAALQHALKAAGYFSGTVNGDFGATTKTALEHWQSHQGLSKTGTITTSRFVWVPKGAVVESWSVGLGSSVSSSTALATVYYPRDLIAQALVAQADISALKVGQKATLTIDGATSDPFTATITSIAGEPASSSSGSSSSTVEYTVDLASHALPSLAKSGMTGTLVVTIAKRSNVLVVPTSAISGSSSSIFVRVMMNGKPAYRQVTTGMATSSLTQITSGLAAGEVVVTGQYTNSATGTTSTTTGGFGGLGGFSGGGFRRSSGGSTSGGGSFGGGQ